MPSIATYTPYESLLFFQSVARHGADSAAFEDISTALNANEFIRESATYDTNRFTADALQGLYEELTTSESNATRADINGDAARNGSNSRKRKLSSSPDPPAENGIESRDQRIVQALVDSLYVRYKEQVIREIKQDEEAYTKLQEEIKDIQSQIQSEEQSRSLVGQAAGPEDSTQSDAVQRDVGKQVTETASKTESPARPSAPSDGRPSPVPLGQTHVSPSTAAVVASGQSSALPSQPQQQHARLDSVTNAIQSPSESVSPRPLQPPPPLQYTDQQAHHSPSAFHNRTLPPPSPQRANYGPISAQHNFQHGSPSHPIGMLPLVPGMPPMPPPGDYSVQQRRTSSGQGRGSPLPYQQQPPYTGYPPYPPPPGPWPQQAHGQPLHQYPPSSPYTNPQYYGQPQPGRLPAHMQTPRPNQFQQFPQATPPTHFKGQPIWQAPPGQGWNLPTASAASTPVARPTDRGSAVRWSGSSTPWKRRPEIVGALRPPSPVRPVREVSPLIDTETPVPESENKEGDQPSGGKSGRASRSTTKKKGEDLEPIQSSRSTRRTRAGSTASSAVGPSSRSQSIASFASDRLERTGTARGRGRKIKNEPPSTPAPFSSDNEAQRSSGRRARARNDTTTSRPAALATASKRKRSSANYSSPTPALTSPAHPAPLGHQPIAVDPSLVTVSKNFAKTANRLVTEITAHRVANNFSKPLTEGIAPGHKSLILRPQDLKSIKVAVNKGGRAVAAVIEVVEEELGDVAGTGAGTHLVAKTEELVPPKGIVNSAQLEMELVRMFANAVMFNPLATKERGFGPELKLARDGVFRDESEPSDDVLDDEAEDGGIISQSREMCKDVMELVQKYRILEEDRLAADIDEGGQRGAMATALRAGSVSMSVNSAVADESASVPEEGEASALGTSRKRRKIADA